MKKKVIMTNSQAQFLKMTETPIPNLVSRLAVPTIISMLVSSIYNMADTFFVAKLGTSAAGAVGIVFFSDGCYSGNRIWTWNGFRK